MTELNTTEALQQEWQKTFQEHHQLLLINQRLRRALQCLQEAATHKYAAARVVEQRLGRTLGAIRVYLEYTEFDQCTDRFIWSVHSQCEKTQREVKNWAAMALHDEETIIQLLDTLNTEEKQHANHHPG